jgi:hypothetical protein
MLERLFEGKKTAYLLKNKRIFREYMLQYYGASYSTGGGGNTYWEYIISMRFGS